MTIQQLKYIIKIVECGSITEAARQLFISQPSLSAAVKELEQEYGIEIFYRTPKGISLSADGTEFLSYARQIIEQAVLEMGADEDTARRRAQHMLEHFELEPALWDMYPNTFSGGEKLRLNIAAAMVKKPRLLLLDEPTASLDHTSKQKVRDLIEQLKLEGTTMLGIFHDLEFMEGLCDREYNMQKGMMA